MTTPKPENEVGEAPKPQAGSSFDQIAEESKARISKDQEQTPKRETKANASSVSGAGGGDSSGPAVGLVYQPTIVKTVVSQATKGFCDSRAEITKIDTWKCSQDEADAVGVSVDHLLQVWFPDMGGGNPKIQTLITFVMTTGYVVGARVLAESKVRAAVEKKMKEEQRAKAAAEEPEKQPSGKFQETVPTSLEGMQ